MRTLVLQLARFGDVYQTWPTLNALVERGDDVHVLVRERFRGALEGLSGVTTHALDSADVLAPLLNGVDDDAEAVRRLTSMLDQLAEVGFTRVINLSFSPLSSFITDYLSGEGVEVRGYTRHADGFFTVADDFSAYFYAQVGIGRTNRYHLIDLFAGVAGVELTDRHVQAAVPARARTGVVVHLGASQAEKAYPAELWAEVIKGLQSESVTVIGSRDERALAEATIRAAGRADVVNRAGETAVAELFEILAGAKLLIGADSAPVHVAGLTGTPVLNLSCDAVNFRETGPISAGSRVLKVESIAMLTPARVIAEASAMLTGLGPAGPCFVRPSRGENFVAMGGQTEAGDFAWALTEALYTGSTYPATDDAATLMAFKRIFELAELALTALDQWTGAGQAQAARQLALIDDLLKEVPRLNANVVPLTQWFETERLRLGPTDPAATLTATTKIFGDLKTISSVYLSEAPLADVVAEVVALGQAIAPALREYDFARVEGEFHQLVSVLQDVARRSTKVEGWSERVGGLSDRLAARDFIELADRIEFDLPRDLKTLNTDVIV